MGREPGAAGDVIVPAILDDRVSSFAVALRPGGARAAEFAAGRLCAHASLRAAGARGPIELRAAASGAPVWPRGFIGSIAHSPSIAWAVAARAARARGVGVDVEEVAAGENLRAASSIALDAHERAIVGASPSAVTAAFSAKESLFKCLAPVAGTRFDFGDARVVAFGQGRLRLHLMRALGPLAAGLALDGRYAIARGHVFTAVVLDA